MPDFYFSPIANGHLTHLVLSATVAGYLWYLAAKQKRRNPIATALSMLAGATAAFSVVSLLFFSNAALKSPARFYVIPLETPVYMLFVTLILQFAYHFPSLDPRQRREARLVLLLCVLDILLEIVLSFNSFAALQQGGPVRFRPEWADYPMLIAFFWCLVVFLRKLRASPGSGTAWQRFWHPQERTAQALRAFALLTLFLIAVESTEALRSHHLLSSDMTEIIQSLGILFLLFAISLTLFNSLPDLSPFTAKVVGIALAANLGVISLVGWVIYPIYSSTYPNPENLRPRRMLRFNPDPGGGYRVTQAKYVFEDLSGASPAAAGATGLGFDFPFFGRTWSQVYLSENGSLSFGQPLDIRKDLKINYGRVPAIFPLAVELDPAAGGLWLQRLPGRLVITWDQARDPHNPRALYTFQVRLFQDGRFTISYAGLPRRFCVSLDEPAEAPWLVGAIPGDSQDSLQPSYFLSHLPYTSGPQGLVQDYYLEYRRYIHRLYFPLGVLLLASSVVIALGLGFFFTRNLVHPLNRLLKGVDQLNRGQLEAPVPVEFSDEIGFLTQSFNQMATRLNAYTQDLECRNLELEALVHLSDTLRPAQTQDEMVPLLLQETASTVQAETVTFLLQNEYTMVVAGSCGVSPEAVGGWQYLDALPCWPYWLNEGDLHLASRHPPQQLGCIHCSLLKYQADNRQRMVIIPLELKEHQLGLLHLVFAGEHQAAETSERLLQAVANIARNALQRAMTLDQLEQLVRDRTRELAALLDIANTAAGYPDLPVMLERVMDKTLEIVGRETGCIHLLDETGENLRLGIQSGLSPGFLGEEEPTPPGEPAAQYHHAAQPWMRVLLQDETLVASIQSPYQPAAVIHYLGVPLHAGGQVTGVMSILDQVGQPFTHEEILLLKGIGDQLGAAVENARLHHRASASAVQEERRRLARDLHDSMTQSLHSLVLLADTAQSLITRRQYAPLDSLLKRLGHNTRQALKEMRLLLFEMRLAPLEQARLVELLQLRLDTVEKRAGVKTELSVEGGECWPKAWERELYGIVMEALNNTLRHAHATQVAIRLRCTNSQMELVVSDDGCGFNPGEQQKGRMGLIGMAERAEKLGGRLDIESEPGAGTAIHFTTGFWTPDSEEF